MITDSNEYSNEYSNESTSLLLGERRNYQLPIIITSKNKTSWIHRLEVFWLKKNDEDDIVTLGVKRFFLVLSICFLLWLISFDLIMAQIIYFSNILDLIFLFFIPMWIGSVLGICYSIQISYDVCRNSTLISKERRQFMKEEGLDNDLNFIDYESLPIMRQLFCWNTTLFLSFLLAFISQILFYFWFIGSSIKSLWYVLLPDYIIYIGSLVFMCLLKAYSPLTCLAYGLVGLQIVSFSQLPSYFFINNPSL